MEKTEKDAFTPVKKPLCFIPIDGEAEMQFRAMKVRNDFRTMGFLSWGDFFAEVVREYPEMELLENFKRLQAFWWLRNFDEVLIEKLEVLADNLKEEA